MLELSAFPGSDEAAIAPIEAMELEFAAVQALKGLEIGAEADGVGDMPAAFFGGLGTIAENDAADARIGGVVDK